MTTKFEMLVNDYHIFDDEPFHLCRFSVDGYRYLIGWEVEESEGIDQARWLKGYLKPEGEALEVYRAFRNA
jgi:hypothetical protein